ncbi:MAG: UDP-N-acetylglucosamine-peptide N-acetylglucosaminyltransferase [Proteobacteria bacterium]|nr:UDP-N-acetylglucosamine-peptide N-acetylglucosaminyltransferase [Pseudomonadota bacterium]
MIIDPNQTLLQTCRALDILGLYSQALEILNTAGATGGNLKISEQAVRLCLLTAAWQDLPRWSEQYRQHFAAHISRRGTPTSRLPVATPFMSKKEAGLPAGQFVFACFNNAFKIRPEDFDAWAEILHQQENSVLWLYTAGHRDLENGLRRQAIERDIDPARLIFAPWLPIDKHMARMPLADLFLDTINYNAGATAVCSLSAGVPVLTKAGDRMLSRMGASLNYSLGLESMTVSDVQTYVRSAVELARDELKLREVREKLKPSQENLNPLFSLVEFTAGYEQLLISAWEGIR